MNASPLLPAESPKRKPDPGLSNRALAGWEIVSVASSIAIAEWMLTSALGFSKLLIAGPVVLAIVLILVSHRVHREGPRELGFRFDNFRKAVGLLALPAIIIAGLFLLIAWITASPIELLRWLSNRNLALQLAFGFAWALAQQYVLQGFFNRRAVIVLGRGWHSVLLVSAVFGLLHLPNPWIVLITFLAGAVWAAIYQRAPNLFALALTHVGMTWFIVSTLPPWMLRHLRVGLGYFG